MFQHTSDGYSRGYVSFAHSLLYFFHFSLSPIKRYKILSEFSRKLWGLEGWNFIQTWMVDSCVVYTEIRLLLLIHPFSSSFFFLSNFQILNIFVAFFSGTVRPRKLKLVTHVKNGWMYHVYQNQTAAAYLFLHFSVFQTLKILSHFSQELWVIESWNFVNTWTMGECIVYTEINYCCVFIPFFIFLSVQFSKIKMFHHTFLRNCEV